MLTLPGVAGDGSYKLSYDGGSVTTIKTGTGLKFYLDQNRIRFVRGNEDAISIPAAAITEITYGQDVHRRIGAAIGIGVVTLGVGACIGLG